METKASEAAMKAGSDIVNAIFPSHRFSENELARLDTTRIYARIIDSAFAAEREKTRELREALKLLMQRMNANELLGKDDSLGRHDQEAYDKARDILARTAAIAKATKTL